MDMVISHETALQAVRRGAVVGAEATCPALPGRIGVGALRRARRALIEAGLLDRGQTMHVLLMPGQNRSRCRGIQTHRWTADRPLPLRELGWVGQPGSEGAVHLFVVDPRLLFVEMAACLSDVSAILLGWELCGRYGKVLPNDPRVGLRGRGFAARDPLVTRKGIESFLSSFPSGLAGARRARRAVRFVRDRARSPMEVAVALLLLAPARMGGLGLPAPLVNVRIPLKPRAGALTREPFFEVDFCWLERRVVVEYNGFYFHDGDPSKRAAARDALRRNELQQRGVRVIQLTGTDVMDPVRFELHARNIAQALGWRLRLEAKGWAERFRELHAAVMGLEYVPPLDCDDAIM